MKRALAKWLKKAACNGKGDLFASYDEADINQAREICADCEVAEPCLDYMWDSNMIAAGTTRLDRLMVSWRRIEREGENNFEEEC